MNRLLHASHPVGRGVVLALLTVSLSLLAGCAPFSPASPKNVILLVGDGMGFEQVRAAGFYANGRDGSLFMESLPRKAQVITWPAYTPPNPKAPKVSPRVTDSAAAATAYATGHKVCNYVLSRAIPGDGKPLPTALELHAREGKMTGLVTTSCLVDATPSAFAAHVGSRGQAADIGKAFFAQRVNVLLGGNGPLQFDLAPYAVKAGGYELATDRRSLRAVTPRAGAHVLGLFSKGVMPYEHDYATGVSKGYDTQPHLSEMAAEAIRIVSAEPKGFFLMIEGGLIDKACHANLLERVVGETIEFDKTVKLVCEWAAARGDTLVLVVADHETGDLKVLSGNGKGKYPTVAWGGKGHSAANVPLYAMGPGSDKIAGVLDNTDVFRLMIGTFDRPTKPVPPMASASRPAAVGATK